MNCRRNFKFDKNPFCIRKPVCLRSLQDYESSSEQYSLISNNLANATTHYE